MKIMSSFVCYQYKQFVMSAKWVMPFVVFVLFLAVQYSIVLVGVVSSLAISGLFLFVVMAWIGVMTQELEPEVSEQIMILRLKSARRYYIFRVLFLVLIAGVGTILAVFFPIVKNILSMNTIFSRDVVCADVLGGTLLLVACGFVGAMTGELLHVRVVRERSISVGGAFILTLLAVVRSGVVEEYPLSRFLLWIIPPVSDVVSWFSDVDYFDMEKLVMGVLILIVYGLIMALIKIELLCRRKF